MAKKVLDACCGSKMFWFEKHHPEVIYMDNREVSPMTLGEGKNQRMFEVSPDVVMDFRKMDFANESFSLVVFDPPHLTSLGEKSYMAKKYGVLDKASWREDIKAGFAECFRVLKADGFLIFKWNEHDIVLSEVLKLTEKKPLFGHKTGKKSMTHWVCFMK